MNIVKPGSIFELHNFGSETATQTLVFTHKDGRGGYAPGTTHEEVINVLISRFYQLNTDRPATDNMVIVHLLKLIRQILAQRVSHKQENQNRRREQETTDSSR